MDFSCLQDSRPTSPLIPRSYPPLAYLPALPSTPSPTPPPPLHALDNACSLLTFTSMPLLTQALSLNDLPSHVQQANSHASFKKWFIPSCVPSAIFYTNYSVLSKKPFLYLLCARSFSSMTAFPTKLWISWGQKLYYILCIFISFPFWKVISTQLQ